VDVVLCGGIRVPGLREALKDDYTWIRVDAAVAMSRADPGNEEGIDYLIGALKEGSELGHWRSWAADALGGLGPAARKAVPALVVTITHRSRMSKSHIGPVEPI
jgi:HEAT repeat protein